ncbi:hypothetical protein M514_17914, partial [Trichuris suis]
YRPTHALDQFRISALPDFNLFKPSTHSVFRPIQYLDLFRIRTSRDADQLGPTTHLESRHVQNFDLQERFDKFTISTIRDVNPSNLSTRIAFRTILELGPFENLKRSRTKSSESRLQENNRELRSK